MVRPDVIVQGTRASYEVTVGEVEALRAYVTELAGPQESEAAERMLGQLAALAQHRDGDGAPSVRALHARPGRLSAGRARDGRAAQRGPRPPGRPPLAASPLEAVEGVEEQVRARQVARRRRLVAPAHDRVGADHDQRPLREAARVQDAERAAGGALGLEVRELLELRRRAAP